MPRFTHLHVHSHYSLLDGLGKIDDLVKRVKELNMESVALTDHGVMYGAVDLFITAKENGVKPIIGCEMYLAPNGLENKNTAEDRKRYHLILLARNETGYKNLMKMVSIAHLDGFYYKPRIDKKTLKKYSQGLVGLTACAEGEVPAHVVMRKYSEAKKLALEYENIFGKGNFYLELMHHPRYPQQQIANNGLIKISQNTGIPTVATADIHYIYPDDKQIQDILLCLQTNKKMQDQNRMNLTAFDLHLKSPQEMIKGFKHIPEAIDNTQKVVDLCNFEMKLGEIQLPQFEVPKKFDDFSYLRHLTEQGLKNKIGNKVTPEYKERMEYELDIIKKTGFPSYFLIVQDFTNWAKKEGIVVGPGRGSAAGSLVSYLIGITNLDPIHYKLLFERFLNPERISMPDVDIDFADDRRDEVLEYCRQRYGHDHVAQIITFGTMAARAAIKDVGRVLDYPYDLCDKLSKMIPMFFSIEKALEEVAEFKTAYNTDATAKKIIDIAKRMEGVCRHSSVHACGVVITKDPVTNYTPLQKITRGNLNATVTQYSSSTKSSYVEKIGLLKMDFLGLKNLTILQNTLRIVRKIKNLEIDIEKIPLDDPPAYKLLQEGKTTGVFQLESSGMKRYLKQLKPTVLEDVIAMVALYRPGPMDWIPDFIDGKHGRRQVKYLHPKLEPILKNTYGVAVYQEQVMQITQALAGFTLGEADILRKAMGKKILDLIKEQKIKFIKGCIQNGITQGIAQKVFSFIEPFAGYGFNRSHAACYGLIGYQTAYLKAHFPAEFMAALLTSDQGNSDRVAIEVQECREMGIEVLPPNINESFEEFAVIISEDKKERIRFGLNAIKNVGRPVAHQIVEERKKNSKFNSLADLIERVQIKDLNKKSLEALAKVGALDDLGERNQILNNLENILSFSKNLQKGNANQGSLFGESQLSAPQLLLNKTEPAPKKQKLAWEKELLALYVSGHPISNYQKYLSQVALSINQLNKNLVEQRVTVGGIINTVKKINTKRNQLMMFVSIEDQFSNLEILVFPRTLESTEAIWVEDRVVIVEGRLSDKDGEFKLIAESVREVNESEMTNWKRVQKTQTKYNYNNQPDERQNMPTVAEEVPAEAQYNPAKNNINNNSQPQTESANQPVLINLSKIKNKDVLNILHQIISQAPQGKRKVYLNIDGQKIETNFAIEDNKNILEEIKSKVKECKVEVN